MPTEYEDKREQQVEGEAAFLYSDELPYHNFGHAQGAVEVGMRIVDQCEKEGIPIDRLVVKYALLFHDAGYHEDHRAKGYDTKELYSTVLARNTLQKYGYPDEFIRKVERAIVSTEHDADFSTNEAKAVRAADLANLGSDYATFVRNTKALKKEYELMRHTELTWDQWKAMTKNVVEYYLAQDIRLTSAHDTSEGESRFHVTARAILEQFLTTPNEELEMS